MQPHTKTGGGNSIFSGALNNVQFLSGGVDPQTGLYTSSFDFGDLAGSRSFGATFKLQMQFSPLGTLSETNDSFLGLGWSFFLPGFDPGSMLITLLDGKTYKVDSTSLGWNDQVWRSSRLLQDVKIIGSTHELFGKVITVQNKDGSWYEMVEDTMTNDFILYKIYAPNGRYLWMKYTGLQGRATLNSIVDDEGAQLCSIHYNENKEGSATDNVTTVRMYPGTVEERVIELNFANVNSTLTTLTMVPNPGEALSISFGYHETSLAFTGGGFNTMRSINSVVHPSGATETVLYENRIALPADAPWSSDLPAVSEYQRQDSNLVTTVNTYDLSLTGKNFFGAGQQGVYWTDATDCLADLAIVYEYTNRVTEDGTRVTEYTYNKFHQEISKTVHHGDPTRKWTLATDHYGEEDVALANQDPRYELPEVQTLTIEDDGRTSVRSTQFVHDNWGNETQKTAINGVVQTTEFYPETAVNDPTNGFVCPAHPFGMRNFPKMVTHTPTGGGDEVVLVHTYKTRPTVDGTGSMVVRATVSQNGQTGTFYYAGESACSAGTSPDEFDLAGAICKEVHEVDGQTRTMAYSYTFDAAQNAKVTTQAFTGSDGTSSSSVETASYLSGILLASTEANGTTQSYAYDRIGRITGMTEAVGTAFESTTSYRYIALADLDGTVDYHDDIAGEVGCGWMICEENAAKDHFQHTIYDGDRRELRSYVRAASNSFYKISEMAYDGLGRARIERSLDYDFRGDSPVTHEESEETIYGLWGEPLEKISQDGLIERTEVSLVDLQVTKQKIRRDNTGAPETVTASQSQLQTTYNLFAKPVSKVRIGTGDPEPVESKTYDGFGRLKTHENAVGDTVEVVSRDANGRPLEVIHLDGSLFTLTYEATNHGKTPASISVQSAPGQLRDAASCTVGSRSTDLLERVTSRTIGTATTTYDYHGGASHPYRSINTRQQTTLFDFIPALGDRPRRVTTFQGVVTEDQWETATSLSDDHFTYGDNSTHTDTPLGELKGTSTLHSSAMGYVHRADGLVSESSQTTNGVTYRHEIVHQTLLGKVLEVKLDADGQARNVLLTYDGQGNLTKVQDGPTTVETALDDFGQPFTEKVSEGGVEQQFTEVLYNEHGLERKRTIHSKLASTILVLETEYDAEDRVERRQTTVNGSLKRVETFGYDAKGRLLAYGHEEGWDAAYLPVNEYGLPFVSQGFLYDGFDNIEQLTTVLASGDTNTGTYTYTGQQLSSIQNDLHGDGQFPAQVDLGYDPDGNLTQMGPLTMAYNPFGRLETCNGVTYQYDALQRVERVGETNRMYFQTQVMGEDTAGARTDLVRSGVRTICERSGGTTTVLGTDRNGSAVMSSADGSAEVIAYSPFGDGGSTARTGYNGELRDVQSQGYLLGNGIRVYFPILGSFASQDDFAPFSGGGLHPYAYCHRDPINLIDPSGHMSEKAQLGTAIATGILGVLMSIAGVILAIPTGGASLGATAAGWAAVGMSFVGFAGSVLTLTEASIAMDDYRTGKDRSEQMGKLHKASFWLNTISTIFSVSKMGYGLVGKGPQFPKTLGDKWVYDPLMDKGKAKYADLRSRGKVPSVKKAKAKAQSRYRNLKNKITKPFGKESYYLEHLDETPAPIQSSGSIRNVPTQNEPVYLPGDPPRLLLKSDEVIGPPPSQRLWTGRALDTLRITYVAMSVIPIP